MTRLIGAAVAILLFVVVLAFNPWAKDVFEGTKAFIVCIGAAGLLLLMACSGHFGRLNRLFPPVLAVIATYSVATAFSVDRAVSWSGLVSLGGLVLLLAYVIVALAATRANVTWIAAAASVAGVIAAGYGVAQRFGLDFTTWRQCSVFSTWEVGLEPPTCLASHDAIGTFGNADFLGFYLAMALPLTLFLARSRWPWYVAAGVEAAGLVASSSRSAWLGAGIGLLVLLWPVLPQAALLGVIVIGLAGMAYIERSPQRHDSLVARRVVWQEVGALVTQRPVIGWGPETLGEVYTHEVDSTRWTHAHNRWIDALFERGVVGLASDLWLLIATALVAIRARTLRSRALLGAYLAGSAAAMAGVTPVPGWLLQWTCIGLIAGEARYGR